MLIFAFGMMKPETDNNVNQTRVNTVKDYIAKHYRDELRLAELADLANVVPTSLCHIFKSQTGNTLSSYIAQVRIGHAKELLLNGDTAVKQIAYECGFSTVTNFNRLFKKYAGCTPTELREDAKVRKCLTCGSRESE